MAYNSDGYIMIDFAEVDFRRTNQTIEGLFKRCVDVIGTNKFILVINANGRTPLPATCSFTNNQYVIDTVIYMFAVSSNDNLFIRRNDVPASDIIDDSFISVDKTWSSNKIDSELDGKQDTLTPISPISINADNEISVDLSGKQNVLTPNSPISIENDHISVDLSSKQDVLTAGDNISIVNNVISAEGIKSFTYIGDGNMNKTIKFPTVPKLVLSIDGKGEVAPNALVCLGCPIHHNSTFLPVLYRRSSTQGQMVPQASGITSFVGDTLIINSVATYPEFIFNTVDTTYTVYYI